jgi:hypothetical protein
MSRIPLSDESADLDDDVVEEEGSPGKEEQYAELDFDAHEERVYEPGFDVFYDDEDVFSDGEWSDDDVA